ncbi:hypothetical protein MTO96_049174 [Rhipicephalus appendiculatus]
MWLEPYAVPGHHGEECAGRTLVDATLAPPEWLAAADRTAPRRERVRLSFAERSYRGLRFGCVEGQELPRNTVIQRKTGENGDKRLGGPTLLLYLIELSFVLYVPLYGWRNAQRKAPNQKQIKTRNCVAHAPKTRIRSAVHVRSAAANHSGGASVATTSARSAHSPPWCPDTAHSPRHITGDPARDAIRQAAAGESAERRWLVLSAAAMTTAVPPPPLSAPSPP